LCCELQALHSGQHALVCPNAIHRPQGQRMRAVLYLLWKQEGEKEDFEIYYKKKTEAFITFLKGKLDE